MELTFIHQCQLRILGKMKNAVGHLTAQVKSGEGSSRHGFSWEHCVFHLQGQGGQS